MEPNHIDWICWRIGLSRFEWHWCHVGEWHITLAIRIHMYASSDIFEHFQAFNSETNGPINRWQSSMWCKISMRFDSFPYFRERVSRKMLDFSLFHRYTNSKIHHTLGSSMFTQKNLTTNRWKWPFVVSIGFEVKSWKKTGSKITQIAWILYEMIEI